MKTRAFEQNFLGFAASKKLLAKGDKILVGCSGGPD